jgi:hypothetical protein
MDSLTPDNVPVDGTVTRIERQEPWSCPICRDIDPLCLLVTCEERLLMERLGD